VKFLVSQLLYFWQDRHSRINVLALSRFLALLGAMIVLYSVLFHYIMAYEGREESWITGFYWTLTVMSTLGFGDITFVSDLGRLFSIVVLLSGIVMLLILLPFTFIELFYAPWIKAHEAARAPTALPAGTRGHVIITHLDAVTEALIERLQQFDYGYVLVVGELDEALRLHDLGYRVVRGDLDSPQTYRDLRTGEAAMVVTTANDRLNTNIAFTVRAVNPAVPIVATAAAAASVDILELAGCNHVLQLGEMMGEAIVRKVFGGGPPAHVVGQFKDLLIAEATVRGTSLVGKTLSESKLRSEAGVTVLGVWERGEFTCAGPDTLVKAETVLVLSGSAGQLALYNEHFRQEQPPSAPVLIIGGGRVGRAAGRDLLARGLDYRMVELLPERVRVPERTVVGDAADLAVLEAGGIRTTACVLVTTHDDDTNIYLTLYCRRLRSDVQIISRARLERNVDTLYRAGADFVLSYASMGSSTIMNYLDASSILMVAEGLDVFEVRTPPAMEGKTIAEAGIREQTGCLVVAIEDNGATVVNPSPHTVLRPRAELILIGTDEAEARFLKLLHA
jgi:Trk K+ transport system NAD-binding subunit